MTELQPKTLKFLNSLMHESKTGDDRCVTPQCIDVVMARHTNSTLKLQHHVTLSLKYAHVRLKYTVINKIPRPYSVVLCFDLCTIFRTWLSLIHFSSMNWQLLGSITAPSDPSAWAGFDPKTWLVFQSLNGLTIDGNGQIDGQGSAWWKQCGVRT